MQPLALNSWVICLPRVTGPSRPFAVSGLDYAGPIWMRTTKGHGHNIVGFVCFATRAVHLEAYSDYTADGFIAAYKRFSARRGISTFLYSDCGTNFVGADGQLRTLSDEVSAFLSTISCYLADNGTTWRFNPPAAPHFGGLWEAAVRCVKHHLRRVVGDITLTFEEMTTFLTQVEACLNLRPLQAQSDDPNDLEPLTPKSFLDRFSDLHGSRALAHQHSTEPTATLATYQTNVLGLLDQMVL